MFQGLAADGAKLALWKLWRANYRIVAFVHDQVLIEVPSSANHKAVQQHIEELMISGMKEVVPDVSVSVESAYLRRWSKAAADRIAVNDKDVAVAAFSTVVAA